MHFIGLSGHPRRYPDTTAVTFLEPLNPVHTFMTVAAFITIGAQFIFVLNLVWSLWKGKKAESLNPWEATSLEWGISSPPPHDNFGGRYPTVHRGAYEYSVPGAGKDYTPQDEPEPAPAAGD
jgi:cytochrome c oxidase subunit 1